MPPTFFSLRITCGSERKDDVIRWLSANTEDYWCQLEVGEKEGKEHFQCAIYTKKGVRHTTIANSVRKTLNITDCNCSPVPKGARRTVLQRYSTKMNTRKDGPWSSKDLYLGRDLKMIEESPFPFQKDIIEMLADQPDDRKVVCYINEAGNCGKSKLVKYLCFHKMAKAIKVTSADRLAAAICSAGAKKAYVIDIPRSVDPQKSLRAVFEVIECLKNGHVIDNFYGHDEELFMESPHVIVFSNYPPPREMLSDDRWDIRNLE